MTVFDRCDGCEHAIMGRGYEHDGKKYCIEICYHLKMLVDENSSFVPVNEPEQRSPN